MRQRIRLTETSLHRIVKESVRRVLNEISTELARKASERALQYAKEMDFYGDYYNKHNFKNSAEKRRWINKKARQSERFKQYADEKKKGS